MPPGKKVKAPLTSTQHFVKNFSNSKWRHDTQQNDTHHDDIEHGDTQHNDIQHNNKLNAILGT
jgi:hypothetical protein